MSVALRQTNLAGYSEVLRMMAGALDACGCVLWQLAPGYEADRTGGHLFVSESWFEGDTLRSQRELPLESSVTGTALLTGKPIHVPDVHADALVNIGDHSLSGLSVRGMCSVPFTSADEGRGVLNFYRTTSEPFDEGDLRRAEEFAALIPVLYRAIRNEISLRLISDVDRELHEADLRSGDDYFSEEKTARVFQRICAALSDAFQCVETSALLENRLENPGLYELVATTWPGTFPENARSVRAGYGLTGWALAHARPVLIFDLANWERDQEAIRKQYPDITRRDTPYVRKVAGRLPATLPDDLPPVSFMAAPLMSGEEVLGVIRCAVPLRGLYFSGRDVSLLALVAAQVTRFWNNWLSRREAFEENRFLESLVAGVGKLNAFVNKQFAGGEPEKSRIFAKALRVVGSVISEADVSDVRLFDAESRTLYFAQTYGEGRDSDVPPPVQKQLRFPVDGGWPESLGARVFATGETYVAQDVDLDPYVSGGEISERTKAMLVAPISVGGQTFGVLDVRSARRGAFTASAQSAARLLGQQLGLYCYLADAIRDLGRHVREIQVIRGQQAQTFEDLTHQLKSPVNQAYMRIQTVLESGVPDEGLRRRLTAVRGLCRKASYVGTSVRLFADLAQGRPLEPHLSQMWYDDTMKAAVEAATDSELMIDPARGIRFRVDEKGFRVLDSHKVMVDPDLFYQALSSILDNAGKYSYAETTVIISAGLSATGRFYVSVQNKGLPVRAEEVRHIAERSWRGERAKSATGEGSGIGLWIVNHIMRAHGGELLVTPTSYEGVTDVRLMFPGVTEGRRQV